MWLSMGPGATGMVHYGAKWCIVQTWPLVEAGSDKAFPFPGAPQSA